MTKIKKEEIREEQQLQEELEKYSTPDIIDEVERRAREKYTDEWKKEIEEEIRENGRINRWGGYAKNGNGWGRYNPDSDSSNSEVISYYRYAKNGNYQHATVSNKGDLIYFKESKHFRQLCLPYESPRYIHRRAYYSYREGRELTPNY